MIEPGQFVSHARPVREGLGVVIGPLWGREAYGRILAALLAAPELAPMDLGGAIIRLPLDLGPALLADLDAAGRLTDDLLVSSVASVWERSPYPQAVADLDLWAGWFARTGYVLDGHKPGHGRRIPRPHAALTLYRGSVPERRADWSWTPQRKIAERYAFGGIEGRPEGAVWTAHVEPDRLLARCLISGGYSDGGDPLVDEYVVNTDGLVIERAE